VAEDGKATESDHTWHGVLWVADDGDASEVVRGVALGEKACEQPLDDGMLEVQLDDGRAELARRLEHDGQGRALAPLLERFVATARAAGAVERGSPGGADLGQPIRHQLWLFRR
jgi:hypothetical protein